VQTFIQNQSLKIETNYLNKKIETEKIKEK